MINISFAMINSISFYKCARTRKEYWNVIRSFDKLTGHDPLKLTRKDAMNYYNNLIEKVNSGRLSYNTAVMRLSVMKSVCTFIKAPYNIPIFFSCSCT